MPICVGSGTITFSHGTMTNPASAILEILKIPTWSLFVEVKLKMN